MSTSELTDLRLNSRILQDVIKVWHSLDTHVWYGDWVPFENKVGAGIFLQELHKNL